MSLSHAIKISLKNCEEKKQTKKLKSKPKKKKKTEKTKKKRKINWEAVKKNIEKYDELSKVEQKEADKNWGRTIPFWKRALKFHNQGLSDSKAIKKAKES